MSSNPLRTLVLTVMVLSLSACAALRAREGPAPVWSEAQRARLQERAAHWRSYQATLHFTAETEKGRLQRVRALVLAVPPDRFRLEAMSPFGNILALFLVEAAGASLWIPSDQALMTADRPETLLKKALGLPLPFEPFAYSLAAAIPPDQLDGALLESGPGGLLLVSREPHQGWSFSWSFLDSPFALRQLMVRNGEQKYSITYDPPVPVEIDAVPTRISVATAEGQVDLKVDQMKPAPTLQEAAFSVTLPEGTRRIDLGPGPWKAKDL